jgi:hypothetical protein
MNHSKILFGLTAVFTLIIALAWSYIPAADLPGYLSFSDQRNFFGIANAFDVISNLGFFLVAIYGFYLARKNTSLPKEYIIVGTILSLATLLTFFGSSYFHLAPDIDRLFWDRLPMTLAFGGITSLLVIDRIDKKIGLMLAGILIPLAIFSAVGWHLEWLTLRPYIALQYGSMVFVVLVTLLCRKGLLANSIIWSSLGFYGVAKFFEVFDSQIFTMNGFISGHTIKHILAALAILKLLTYLKEKKS